MLKWTLLIPTLALFLVACGRQESRRDAEVNALRKHQEIQNQLNSSNVLARAQMQKLNTEVKDSQDRLRKDIKDDNFRHGVLVLSGGIVSDPDDHDDAGTSSGDHVEVEADHGKVTYNTPRGKEKRKNSVEKSAIPALERVDFSKSISAWARQKIKQASNTFARDDEESEFREVHIGCDELFEETSSSEFPDLADLDKDEVLQPDALKSELKRIKKKRDDEDEDDDEEEEEEEELSDDEKYDKLLSDSQKNIYAMKEAAGSHLIKDWTVTKWQNDFEVSAETVILCGSAPSGYMKIAAKNLVLKDFNASLQTEQGADFKYFNAYAENLYLLGNNEIASFGVKDGKGVYQSGPQIRIEVQNVKKSGKSDKKKEINFAKGRLKILAKGAGAN